jgi:hypothetical protein
MKREKEKSCEEKKINVRRRIRTGFGSHASALKRLKLKMHLKGFINKIKKTKRNIFSFFSFKSFFD